MTDVWAYLRSLSQEELAARLDQMPLAEQQELLALLEQERAQDLRAKVQLPPLYPLQQEIKDGAARFNVICIGRRAGKTYLCTHLALETALRGYPAGWFVPEHKDALEVWAELTRRLKPIATKINASEKRIELPNRGLIEVWTMENNPDAGRSRKYKTVIVDEAAKAPLLKAAWQEAIRPTLTDYSGDAWFPSTPKGLNYFYELFQAGVDPLQPLWKSWQLPSEVNPYLPPGEIEIARADLPELVFKQEYLAEFITSDGAVFRNVEFVLTARPTLPADHRGHIIVAGVDLAQLHDFTAISIYCCTCNQEVALERWNQLGWALQRGRLLNILIKWGVQYALIELNSIGSPNFEALHELAPPTIRVAAFKTSAQSKPPLVQQAALAIERAAVSFLSDPVAKFELLAFECNVTAHGYPQYSAPEGQHDDTVIARCLALEAKRRNPLPPKGIKERAAQRFQREVDVSAQRVGQTESAQFPLNPDEQFRYDIAKQDLLDQYTRELEEDEMSAWERSWKDLC